MTPVAPCCRLVPALLAAGLLGCAAGSENTSLAEVTLRNADDLPVYILAQTESVGSATLLAPGASRVVQLDYTPGNPLGAAFVAYRDGQQLDRTYCFARHTDGVLAPEVGWDGDRLICQRWGT